MVVRVWASCTVLIALLVTGCAERPVNPSFAISNDQARAALHAMAAEPKQLDRPLVIVGGYEDPGLGGLIVQWQLDPLIHDRRVVQVCLLTAGTFDDCREQIVAAVDKA